MTTTIFVMSALASINLVTSFVTTKICVLFVNHLVGLVNPTKSSPHFITGSYGKVVTILVRFCGVKPLACW
jgi:hypothetical protein